MLLFKEKMEKYTFVLTYGIGIPKIKNKISLFSAGPSTSRSAANCSWQKMATMFDKQKAKRKRTASPPVASAEDGVHSRLTRLQAAKLVKASNLTTSSLRSNPRTKRLTKGKTSHYLLYEMILKIHAF